MATSPLFVSSLATLKAKLRLSGAASTGDAAEIINDTILKVRLGFIRDLGSARVAEIVALPFSEAPSTDDQITRGVANVTEVMWVRYELMALLPTLFQDASGDQNDVWNREAPFRKEGKSDLERQREALFNEIQQNLVMLAGNEDQGEGKSVVQGGSMEADDDPPRIFDSVFPNGIGGLRDAPWGSA